MKEDEVAEEVGAVLRGRLLSSVQSVAAGGDGGPDLRRRYAAPQAIYLF